MTGDLTVVANWQMNPGAGGGNNTSQGYYIVEARVGGEGRPDRAPGCLAVGAELGGGHPAHHAPGVDILHAVIEPVAHVVFGGDLWQFTDGYAVSSYAMDAMRWAVSTGLIGGANGRLSPQASTTRAEAAAILARFCQS